MPTHKLWEPSDSFKENSHLQHYKKWLKQNLNLEFKCYQDLWQWSITNVEEFWKSIWNYFNVISHSPYKNVLTSLFVRNNLNYIFANITIILSYNYETIFTLFLLKTVR